MESKRITRRGFLAGSAALGFSVAARAQDLATLVSPEFDVIVVGSGAAGLSAALGALRADPRASVAVLEARSQYGGTSHRSGGHMWIPNNADMRAAGLADPRADALRYMARLAHPDDYVPHATNLGLRPRHHRQLATYYDHAAPIMDHYRNTGTLAWEAVRMRYFPWTPDPLELSGQLAPDYRPELEENVPKRGRAVTPLRFVPIGAETPADEIVMPNYGASLAGSDLVEWLRHALMARGVPFLFNARVRDVMVEPGSSRVVGVHTDHGTVRARRGVIFAAGGFSKNATRLAENFRGNKAFSGGGCAVTSAQGDLIEIAERRGFLLEHMDKAWLIQNVFEQYEKDPDSQSGANYLLFQAYWLNGDSMFVVNRRGRRVVNEKANYDLRTRVHRKGPDNQFLLSVLDQHTIEYFTGAGGHVTPAFDTLIGPAETVEELTFQIQERFADYPELETFGLDKNFADKLSTTLERFNGFARIGRDQDFQRGETSIELWWHSFCLFFGGVEGRNCISANGYPNPTMRPLEPPYYAVVLSSGLQDTKGGPAIDEYARILDSDEQPVEGLYGAGNCIASPAGDGYWGAGGTLGPAVVFGHIAGHHAAARRLPG